MAIKNLLSRILLANKFATICFWLYILDFIFVSSSQFRGKVLDLIGNKSSQNDSIRKYLIYCYSKYKK